jgi:MOSC domain-containing protein YiiM
LALNISKPKVVKYKGDDVLTGIYNASIEGPRMVRKLNIEGDEQADLTVHGGIDKAVYAFPSEHYFYFQDALKQGPYKPGQFGENLTTEGMLESNVRIGDRYRVGEVVFEVSQPRSPCYKFAIKMGTAEALKVFINSAKTGFYFRVLHEGTIQSGDSIELEFSKDTAPTVEEVHSLYYLDKKNITGLKHASECNSLTKSWRDNFENRIRKLSDRTQ